MNKTKQFKIETPIGSVESDSGNHIVDVISVAFIVIVAAFMECLLNSRVAGSQKEGTLCFYVCNVILLPNKQLLLHLIVHVESWSEKQNLEKTMRYNDA